MIIETLQRVGDASGIHAFMDTAWGWPVIESIHFVGLALICFIFWGTFGRPTAPATAPTQTQSK